MRTCKNCNQSKPLSEFYKVRVDNPNWRSECKVCGRQRCKKNYIKNKELRRSQQKKRTQANQETNREQVFDYLMSHPCVDCGEKDLLVLQFDHRENKHHDICFLMRNYIAWPKLLEEIQKCDVRCANCHMRKTAKYAGYWKVRLMNRNVEILDSNPDTQTKNLPGNDR
jgi:hypothetical protein